MSEPSRLFDGRMPPFIPRLRQAIREERKTQTRRVIKDQPPEEWEPSHYCELYKKEDDEFVFKNGDPVPYGWGVCDADGEYGIKCPYGKPGDVRCMTEPLIRGDDGNAYYQDDGKPVVSLIDGKPLKWRWKVRVLSSLFMPSEAARTFTKYKSIRVELVQDISEEDAIAEGTDTETEFGSLCISIEDESSYSNGLIRGSAIITVYKELWDSINAKRGYSWDLNQLVWVVEFKIEKGK